MHKLIKAYYEFNEALVKADIIKGGAPAPIEEYSLTYDLLPGDDMWRLHVNAAEMTLICNLTPAGNIEAYLPFKDDDLEVYLKKSGADWRTLHGLYCDRVHPHIELMLERQEIPQ